jgi:hypothetical protein
MPLGIKKGKTLSYYDMKIDEEHAQNVFTSWLYKGPRGAEVLRSIEKKCKVKLGPLRLQSEAIYDVEEYSTVGEVDEETARERVALSEKAWQKPEPLLMALETFRACLDLEGVAELLKPTDFTRDEHVEVVNALIAGVRKAVREGATSVCLEADAFLM